MGKVAEAMEEDIGEVARMTGETAEEVHRQWKGTEHTGISFSDFVVVKSRKKVKK